jgi:Protein of unknown function (DUF2934)
MSRRKKAEGVSTSAASPERADDTTRAYAGDTTRPSADREHVAKRAYELYEARGCGDGRAEEDWFSAERELSNGRSRGDA